MQSNGSANHEAVKGLPPVTPPSGKFIAQLFVIPGVIVFVAVGCIWFVTWLVGGFYSPEHFLKTLRSSNPEDRWRAASDLAQVLKKDELLASNAAFGLNLAEMLRQALKDNEQAEAELARRPQPTTPPTTETDPASDPTKIPKHPLQDERAFIEFLIACMGNFSIPVGVPILNDIAMKADGADATTVALRRQLAVWALANVADNLKRFDKLSLERRVDVLSKLDEEAEAASIARREWARASLEFLKARTDQKPQALGVDVALAECAKSDDPSLRKFVALALTFWEGTPAENQRMEETLLKLAKDDGHGAPSEEASLRGREIRYQAAEALARRGSSKASAIIPILNDMLDEDLQAKTFQTRLKNGRTVADGTMVRSVLTGAMKSIAEWKTRDPNVDLLPLLPALEKLSKSDNPVLRTEAERTLLTLNRK